jgi:hypothetical protein
MTSQVPASSEKVSPGWTCIGSEAMTDPGFATALYARFAAVGFLPLAG